VAVVPAENATMARLYAGHSVSTRIPTSRIVVCVGGDAVEA